MPQDARVTSAIAHWAPRFLANGVTLTDFEEVTASVAPGTTGARPGRGAPACTRSSAATRSRAAASSRPASICSAPAFIIISVSFYSFTMFRK